MTKLPDASIQHGRVVITPTPVATPGCCCVCGYAGSDRVYIDYRLDFEFYGTLYFCSDCGMEPARLLGWTDPSKTLDLINANKTLVVQLENLTKRANELEHSLDVFAASRLADSHRHVIHHDGGNNQPAKSEQTASELRGSGKSEVAGNDPASVESIAEQRSDDASDDDFLTGILDL